MGVAGAGKTRGGRRQPVPAAKRDFSLIPLLRKVFGGTGILPVQMHRLEACATSSGGRDARPTIRIHDLRVGRKAHE